MSGSPLDEPVVLAASDVDVTFEAVRHSGLGLRRRQMHQIRALQGVDIELRRGQALGVVGHNGAGKSTLLRAIAGIIPVSGGSIRVHGQPQLLGVQAALLGKLTGWRNIELGLLALGNSKSQARAQAEAVAEFSRLGPALDLEVRTYSSGMRARLAFSISTTAVPDILLMDEALAVGDKDFKARSLRRMRQIRRKAGTIVVATHSLNEVTETCDMALWLEQGQVVELGSADEVVESYRTSRRRANK